MKFWYAGVPLVSGGFGITSWAFTASVVGSITRSTGGATDDGQTLRMFPWVSNAIVPQSDAGSEPEKANGVLPSGPERW